MRARLNNGIDIEYEVIGSPAAPPVILIMGLGMQLLTWRLSFCERIAEAGFRVVRFDNRDVGLSTKLDGVRAPAMVVLEAKRRLGLPIRVPYTLAEMALDTLGLLDWLDVDDAHVVGGSMGGMIAQILAARHPRRVRSLTSIMSTTSNPRLPGPRLEVIKHMMTPPPKDREGIVRHAMRLWELIGSPAYPPAPAELRARMERSIDRSYYPQGFIRHLAAIAASGDRTREVGRIRAPTLVIHGAADPMVPLAGGLETAKHIPGARLEVIEGMGHDLPLQLVPRLAELIVDHLRAVEDAG